MFGSRNAARRTLAALEQAPAPAAAPATPHHLPDWLVTWQVPQAEVNGDLLVDLHHDLLTAAALGGREQYLAAAGIVRRLARECTREHVCFAEAGVSLHHLVTCAEKFLQAKRNPS